MTNGNNETPKQEKLVDVIRGTISAGINKRPKRKISVLAVLGCVIVTAFVVPQSQLYIQYCGSHLLGKSLSDHVIKSGELRRAAVKNQLRLPAQPTPKIRVHVLFNKRQEALITKAVNEVLNDSEAQKHFPKIDGRNLQETEVVIVPLWKFDNANDWSQMGITEAGYVWTKYGMGLNPEAVIIREKPLEKNIVRKLKLDDDKHDKINGQPRLTDNGTPRIFLTQNLLHEGAFDRLKFTLLHEFVHAHEVPGFEVWPTNFIHNDLTYLPAYCEMMDKLGLDTGKKSLEYFLLSSIPLFLLVIVWFSYLAWLGDRSR